MILNETYTLNNGYKIPKIAFGTWQIDNNTVIKAVNAALEAGYRSIDTAAAYANEEGIGKAIIDSKIAREDIFITSKIPAEVKNYNDAYKIINNSLKNLNTSYIDLMLIHAPKPWEELFNGSKNNYFEENINVWKAMEDAVKEGKIRSIGVSNFEISDIENILKHCKIKPVVNQIRVHIGHTPINLINYCKANDITIMAFSPNATGKLMNHPVIKKIADKYHVSIPQLSIRYDYQLGLLPLPRSTNQAHIAENTKIDFTISKEDMNILSQIEEIQSLDI